VLTQDECHNESTKEEVREKVRRLDRMAQTGNKSLEKHGGVTQSLSMSLSLTTGRGPRKK
jgi:hypothetical protein